MDIIRSLLGLLFRLAVLLFVSAIVWWLVTTLYPAMSVKSLFSSIGVGTTTDSGDGWLPAPRLQGLLHNDATSAGFVYSHGTAYNGYGNSYKGNQGGAQVEFVTYTATGTQIIRYGNNNGAMFSGQQGGENISSSNNGQVQKNTYIRNLSIYEGGHAYTGLSFTGEARNEMFQSGMFPVLIIDPAGRVVSRSYAQATSNWSTPGWVRFYVKIDAVLPNKVPCSMIFEEGRGTYTYNTNPPVRVAIPIQCN